MAALRDVAKKAGVSASTVSRVINRPETVPTTTKSRVLKAIKNLNYHPNKFAQRLRSHNVNRKLIMERFKVVKTDYSITIYILPPFVGQAVFYVKNYLSKISNLLSDICGFAALCINI